MLIRVKFSPRPIDTYARIYNQLGAVIHVSLGGTRRREHASYQWDWSKFFDAKQYKASR